MNEVNERLTEKLYNRIYWLSIFTIVYNILEGVISIYFGIADDSLNLFGFGLDSFIECVSGFGVLQMVIRIQFSPQSDRNQFENTALKITGYSFYILSIGLFFSSMYNIWSKHEPTTTIWGVVISLVSIGTMVFLIKYKTIIGKQLDSDAILADIECTRVCVYMSIILLISSVVYEATKFIYIDAIGTLGLVYFSYQEGKECFEKIQNHSSCSHHIRRG